MSEYTTISFKKDFVQDVESYIEEEPFGSVKEFAKHLLVREMESDGAITDEEARRIGRKLEELGYVQ